MTALCGTPGLYPDGLFSAAGLGKWPAVRTLLAAGMRVDHSEPPPRWDGSSGLIGAAHAGQLAMVEHLHGRGADVNLVNESGHSALSCAAYAGRAAVVAYLLAQPGLAFNAKNGCGQTAVCRALDLSRGGRPSPPAAATAAVVRLLCGAGADLCLSRHLPPLLLSAAQGRNREALLVLLRSGATLAEGTPPPHIAASVLLRSCLEWEGVEAGAARAAARAAATRDMDVAEVFAPARGRFLREGDAAGLLWAMQAAGGWPAYKVATRRAQCLLRLQVGAAGAVLPGDHPDRALLHFAYGCDGADAAAAAAAGVPEMRVASSDVFSVLVGFLVG